MVHSHAHALNLHESGVNVIVGLYKGSKSWKKVEDLGLKVMETADAVKAADIVMVLAPDEKQAAIYKKDIEPNLTEGMALAFAHGFNIHFKQIVPPANVDVFMIAPKLRATQFVQNTKKVKVLLALLLYIKMLQVMLGISLSLTVQVSAALVQLFLKQHLSAKLKLTSSVSRLFFAAV